MADTEFDIYHWYISNRLLIGKAGALALPARSPSAGAYCAKTYASVVDILGIAKRAAALAGPDAADFAGQLLPIFESSHAALTPHPR
jgi:hypothetical protein